MIRKIQYYTIQSRSLVTTKHQQNDITAEMLKVGRQKLENSLYGIRNTVERGDNAMHMERLLKWKNVYGKITDVLH